MSYVLRLLLPDRPGTLGAVATALGLVDADILAMDIVERSPDQAVDDIVVSLPSGRQPDVLITAAETVPGVRVESVRPDPGVAARHREWELVEAIAADPEGRRGDPGQDAAAGAAGRLGDGGQGRDQRRRPARFGCWPAVVACRI